MSRRIAGMATLALAGALAGTANAQAPQEPGVTLRTYQLAHGTERACTIKSRPDAERRQADADHQLDDGGPVRRRRTTSSPHVLANLNIATAGEYTFRLTSDDGSRADASTATSSIDHDGLHGDDGQGRRRHADRRLPRARASTTSRPAAARSSSCEWQRPGLQRLRGRPDLRALHRGRRRARDRAGQQVLRGRHRHARRRPAPGRRSTRTTR